MDEKPPDICTAYLAPDGFLPELVQELGCGVHTLGRLALCPGPPRPVAWAQNVWLNPRCIPFSSISEAVRLLKALGPRWTLYDEHLKRRGRARLIQERVPGPALKPLVFGAPPPNAALGSWTLLDETTLLASPACSSPFAHGRPVFSEDKTGPPNRAYLKLWELFTVLQARPGPGQVCLDLGASPGGWTWVLARLGARVISVDKAPLAPGVARLPGVEQRLGSAFGLRPGEAGPVDWLFCDVICYPERLLALARRWLDAGAAANMVCTVKFQGRTDLEIVRAFQAIAGSRLLHLHHNKHELTWFWSASP
ncbi:MAG TPA: hypothetical protein ENN39_10600 [Desulfonatronum sp.]|nr:hypothetical protein [Desulfonatronum sp.]